MLWPKPGALAQTSQVAATVFSIHYTVRTLRTKIIDFCLLLLINPINGQKNQPYQQATGSDYLSFGQNLKFSGPSFHKMCGGSRSAPPTLG